MEEIIIPADSARWFVKQMGIRGIAHGAVLDGTGLDSQWLGLEDARISNIQYMRIVKNALDLSHDPALGLNVGQSQSLFDYGPWGYAIMSSATARDAMNVAFRYWELNGSLVNVSVKIRGTELIWTIQPAFPMDDERILRFAVEELLSTTRTICALLFNEKIMFKSLCLAYPEPGHATLYNELVTGTVTFNADDCALVTDASILDIPTVTGHPAMRDFCEKHCEELLMKLVRRDQLIEQIRHHVIQSMGRFPKADDMAKNLSISPRTLYRRLNEKGTSYQEILDEVRAELAMSYLEHTHLSIDQISDLIGFTETTTFRRAFKKWTEISPSEFRRKRAGG